MGAGSSEAKIKGVFDLLLSRAQQAEVSAKGNGDYTKVDPDIFGALDGDLPVLSLPSSSM